MMWISRLFFVLSSLVYTYQIVQLLGQEPIPAALFLPLVNIEFFNPSAEQFWVEAIWFVEGFLELYMILTMFALLMKYTGVPYGNAAANLMTGGLL